MGYTIIHPQSDKFFLAENDEQPLGFSKCSWSNQVKSIRLIDKS
jgi:hypothetical protein